MDAGNNNLGCVDLGVGFGAGLDIDAGIGVDFGLGLALPVPIPIPNPGTTSSRSLKWDRIRRKLGAEGDKCCAGIGMSVEFKSRLRRKKKADNNVKRLKKGLFEKMGRVGGWVDALFGGV